MGLCPKPREYYGQKENGVSNTVVNETVALGDIDWQKMLRIEEDSYYLLRSDDDSACAVKVNTAGEILDAHDCGNPITYFSPETGCQ